jgi:excisionase family DNA binding protein
MSQPQRLLTIQETAEILHMNPEVVRRWLRAGKISGRKIGSDWRVPVADLEAFLNPDAVKADSAADSGPKMCIKYPKWLDFSGLPLKLNQQFGPTAWSIFKKMVELDFEQGEDENDQIKLDMTEFSGRLGYEEQDILAILKKLAKAGYLILDTRHDIPTWAKIKKPLVTPISVLDIPFRNGGVKGAPEKAFEKRCLRRYVG